MTVEEVCCLQLRLPILCPSRNNGSLTHTFSKLMFLGKISAVLQFLTEHGKSGILHVEDTIYGEQVTSVLETMKSNLNAQPVLAGSYWTVILNSLS